MTSRQSGALKGAFLLVFTCSVLATHGSFVYAQQQEPATTAPVAPAAAPGRGGRGTAPLDPRVQIRSYRFTETNEDLPYAVFVSSKVRSDTKAPLVIALHGLGGNHTTMMRGNALDLAEQGGYILVGPMGYSPSGWYGGPAVGGPGRRGRGPGAPAAPGAPGAPGANPAAASPQAPAPARGPAPVPVGGQAVTDPAKVSELSEKDVMTVLDMIRKEFNVDERRTYLMGHSMGGAGTLFLMVKHARVWAAAAAIAPAAFSLQPASLSQIPEMPVMIVHGDADTVVPVTVSRPWAAQMKQLNMNHRYIEVPGGDHGNVIGIGMPDIFAFFNANAKPAR
jgi:predicted esterase